MCHVESSRIDRIRMPRISRLTVMIVWMVIVVLSLDVLCETRYLIVWVTLRILNSGYIPQIF